MKYEDYGITREEKIKILNYCASAGSDEEKIIKDALIELPPYISTYIFISLTQKRSYDNICKEEYIFLSCGDFYAYRRKGIRAVKDAMISNNIW